MPPSDQEPAYRLVDPSTGDIVGSFYENGNGDVEIQPSDGTQYKFAQSPSDPVDVARLQDVDDGTIEVFEADGTFDATGIDDAYVECVGGGGGGGYRPTPSGSYTDMPGSGGGGGGGYCASYVDLSASSSVTVSVGSGGSGGTSTSIGGEDGGNSSFGGFVEAGGGEGGSGAVENETAALGGETGTDIKGDIQISGGQAGSGYTTGSVVVAGSGGSTVYAADRILPVVEVASTNPGNTFTTNTSGYGWGAPGMVSDATSAFGGDGIVIVRY